MSGNAEQVMARLVEAPERFDFFAALRIIEAAHAERARLGEGRRGGDEPVRLAQPPELAFPPGDIAGLDTPPGRPPRLRTHLMGLFGPHGPLPLHLTVRARERAPVGEFGEEGKRRARVGHRARSTMRRAASPSRKRPASPAI